MFMNRFWKTFRFGVLLAAFITLGIYLIGTTQWNRLFGRKPMYPEFIQEGQPIVDAIYRYKNQRGLWPEYLEDLVPESYTFPQVDKIRETWKYKIELDRRPGLSRPIELRRTHMGFDFDPVNPSWIVFGDEENRHLQSMRPPPPPCTLPADRLLANQLAELDMRIKRSGGPVVIECYRDKVSLLRAAGKLGEARSELETAAAANVHHFWPRLARVKLDLEHPTSAPATTGTASAPATQPQIPQSLADFHAWVKKEPSFTHFYYLSLAYRWVNHDAEALAAITEASRLSPITTAQDERVSQFYLWDMARFAVRQKQYDLVLALTDSWSKIQAARPMTEYSYLPLAAAAKLAKGDVAGAKDNLKTLHEEKPLATWADNVPALEAAVKRGDRAFVYDPGNKKPPYEVFSQPQ